MTISTQCLECKHYTGLCTCEAFPDKIPQEIFDGSFDHANEYYGDNGIRFEEESNISKGEKIIKVKATSKRKAHTRKITFEGKEKEVKKVKDNNIKKQSENFFNEYRNTINGEKNIRSVYSYCSTAYGFINNYLMGEYISPNLNKDDIKLQIKEIESTLKNAPKFEGEVYRGLRFETKDGYDNFLKGCQKGESISWKSFISSTIDKEIAETFGSASQGTYGILFKIKSKTGVYLNGISSNRSEQEVLFNRDLKFKIIKTKKTADNKYEIIIEEK